MGKVGFKTYMNYFTAGAHWFIIIFLILVNVADQVNRTFILICALSLILIYNLYCIYFIIF